MSDTTTARAGKGGRPVERGAAALRRLPRWKKVLLAAAGVFVVGGLGLMGYEHLSGRGDAPAAGKGAETGVDSFRDPVAGGGTPRTSLVGGGPRSGDPSAGGQAAAGAEAGAEEGAAGGWSPLFLKGGLSFFVGFCLGAVLRAFLKISAIVLGLVFLAVFGLSYAGLIPAIDWSAMEGHFNRIVASLSEQASSFKTFIAGNLPSAGMLGLGLFTGLKKS